MEVNMNLGSFLRYLYRIKKELMLGAIMYVIYFYKGLEGKYMPLPRMGGMGFLPYFTFGMRNRGTVSRRNTYIEGFWRTWDDPTKIDMFQPPIEDLQFEGSDFTYITPPRYPADNSWSPSMLEFIRYNLEDNPKLVGNDKVIFQFIVNEIDKIAEYSSKWQRRLCHKYEQASMVNRNAADYYSFGFFRMDSAFVLPNDHNSTKLICKLMWDIKEVTLMSKYQLYMSQSMLKDHLREIRQIMEYLDNAQELPKYYDSPDWNLNGKLAAEILRYDQFIHERLPELADIHYDTHYGPNWWPWAQNRFAQADGTLIALRSLRNFKSNGTAYLHPSAVAFWGMQRAYTYKDRFYNWEEEDVNDQNRFNLGHRPKEYGDGHAYNKMKAYWLNSYCPWGSEGTKQTRVETLADLKEWEQLALESYLTGETQKCNAWTMVDGKEVEIEMNPSWYMMYGSAEKHACKANGFMGPESPGYYMDLLRENFPYNDECYQRQNMVGQPLYYGIVRETAFNYMMRWNYFDINQQTLFELWGAYIVLPALACGNQRGKVISRVNKIHD